MSNQEVFNMLSELEDYFYYRMNNPDGLPFDDLTNLHNKADEMLRDWHSLTGCVN